MKKAKTSTRRWGEQIVFTEARNYSIPIERFTEAWRFWLQQFGTVDHQPSAGREAMPILNRKVGLSALVESTGPFSLEVMCRALVPATYQNTMQVTNRFLRQNQDLIEKLPTKQRMARPEGHSRPVFFAALKHRRDAADASAMRDVEALVEEVSPALERHLRAEATPKRPDSITRQDWICRLVDRIEQDAFRPMYRRRPLAGAKAIYGWSGRLQAYFWPSRRFDYAYNVNTLKPLEARATRLASLNRWKAVQEIEAITLANEIFDWGGVPQDPSTVTVANIRAVFEAARTDTICPEAPMNSGWTKVAAFGSADLESTTGKTQVIWDSRVSASIVGRLDTLLHEAGVTVVPAELANLKYVPGQGGTRSSAWHRGLKCKGWRNGYGRWDAQIAGSAFVREIRDELNRRLRESSRGDPTEDRLWTVRRVEMVLFMDGY